MEQLVFHVVEGLGIHSIKTGCLGRRPDVGWTVLLELGSEMEITEPVRHVIGFGAGVNEFT